jgi:hypothetical protein
MNMFDRLIAVVDMVAAKSRIFGQKWELAGSRSYADLGPIGIRTKAAESVQCPLQYCSRSESWIDAAKEFDLDWGDSSTAFVDGKPRTGLQTFIAAADMGREADDPNSPVYKLREHMINTLGVGV